MEPKHYKELLLQSLEHERGGMKVYQTALECVLNEELQKEWEKYLRETEQHVAILEEVFAALQLDPEEQTPGRTIVGDLGRALVKAMQDAISAGDDDAAEIVACECVVLAETKDHLDWHLIGEVAKKVGGEPGRVMREAWQRVEEQEDEHLYHSKGWCRELWIRSLGLRAVLPPPEERKHVKTAIGAARAEQQRARMR
jgi:rubrerythrin